jgi:uncharacterized protein (TIGR00369 family)
MELQYAPVPGGGMLAAGSWRRAMGGILRGQAILDRLAAGVPEAIRAQLPPPCLLDMRSEPVEYEDGVRLVMRFPMLERYRNPFGYMQGGFVMAALDNTIGPFQFLIAPPSVTAQVSINYLRPITMDQAYLTCEATVLERSRKTLIVTGKAMLVDGKVAAIAQATCQILD